VITVEGIHRHPLRCHERRGQRQWHRYRREFGPHDRWFDGGGPENRDERQRAERHPDQQRSRPTNNSFLSNTIGAATFPIKNGSPNHAADDSFITPQTVPTFVTCAPNQATLALGSPSPVARTSTFPTRS
jgi:hypothetical protein